MKPKIQHMCLSPVLYCRPNESWSEIIMNMFVKILSIAVSCAVLSACGGSSGGSNNSEGGGGGDGGGGFNPTIKAGINIGNIAAIPVTGNQTATALIVTNNSQDKLILTSASVTQGTVTTGLKITEAITSVAFGRIDISQCSRLPANGTCSVAIAPPVASGSYVLTLDYIAPDGSKFSANRLVVFTKSIPSIKGFSYSNLNNKLSVTSGGSTTYAIPFILGQAFDALYAYSDNPSFAANIVCDGITHTVGDLCTAYIKIANLGTNPTVTSKITVSNLPDPNSVPLKAIQKLTGILKGTVGFSFDVPVTVTNALVGNLSASAFNLEINPANGTAAQTVMLLNDGNAPVTNIRISPTDGIITIDPGSCASATLAPNALCTFTVNASTTLSGTSAVNIIYNDNSASDNRDSVMIFTVVYISDTPGPGIAMTAGQGSLQNTITNFTAVLNIAVTNVGTEMLNNIIFTDISDAVGPQFAYNSASTCKTDGSQSLRTGEGCVLIVDYTPTATTPSTLLRISATANYLDQSGHAVSYSNSVFSTNYSAVLQHAFVSLTPNAVAYAIRADNSDTISQDIVIANYGGMSTTLATPSYTWSSAISSIISSIHVTDGCAGITLLENNGNHCTINIVYGSVAAAQALIQGYLNIAYQPLTSIQGTVQAFSTQYFQAESSASVSVSSAVKSGAAGGSGAGTVISPYLFYNSSFTGAPIVLTYTYTNTGTTDAHSFIVHLENVPVGWALVPAGTTCGNGVTPTILGSGASCTLALSAITPGSSAAPYNVVSPINVTTPPFSYHDVNTGFKMGPTSPPTTYVTPQLFASVATNTPTSSSSAQGNFNMTFTSTSGDAAQYPITITIPTAQLPIGSGGNPPLYLTTTNSCAIATPSDSCNINITNIAGAVEKTYSYYYWITPAEVAPASATNSMINYFQFTLN